MRVPPPTPPQEEGRPVLQLRWRATDRTLEILAAAGLVLLILGSITAVATLPRSVPVHFDLAGKADGWGSRSLVLALPIAALVLYVMLSLVARVPHWYNYPRTITPMNAERQYLLARRLVIALKATLVWVFLAILVQTAYVAVRPHSPSTPLLAIAAIGVIAGAVMWYFWASRERQ
jgi:uncharacterized membrane protein